MSNTTSSTSEVIINLFSLSKFHKDNPYRMDVNGQEFKVDYVPGDSNSGMFGGNSNWRGVSCELLILERIII